MNRNATATRGDGRDDVVRANADFYSTANLLLSGLKSRYCSRRLHAVVRFDMTVAAGLLPAPERAVAVDCMTGSGVHVRKLLDAGFGKVIGVDLSEEEIARARTRHSGDSRVEFVRAEIGEFLASHRSEFDFIYLNSLHHIQNYLGLVECASRAVKNGGFLYVLERRRQRWLMQLLGRIDENCYFAFNAPQLFFWKVIRRIGFRNHPAARMWGTAKIAEAHAHTGLDDRKIISLLEEHGFRQLLYRHEFFAATRVADIVLKSICHTPHFRLLMQKGCQAEWRLGAKAE